MIVAVKSRERSFSLGKINRLGKQYTELKWASKEKKCLC